MENKISLLGVMEFRKLTMTITVLFKTFKLSSHFHHTTTFPDPRENQDKNVHHLSAFHNSHL